MRSDLVQPRRIEPVENADLSKKTARIIFVVIVVLGSWLAGLSLGSTDYTGAKFDSEDVENVAPQEQIQTGGCLISERLSRQ